MSEKGFTLIELVIVIIIVGIMAAAALPKFANLTTQAQTSANRGVRGGVTAAIGIAHAAWIASGSPSAGGSVTLDSTSVHVNGNGWPDNSKGIAPAASDCVAIWNAILNDPPTATATTCTGSGTCYVATTTAGSSGNSACLFTLSGATATTITYDLNNGSVTASP